MSTDSRGLNEIRKIGEYEISKEIGKGSFATVYQCVDSKSNEPVAVKSVVRSKLKSKKLIENLEIEVSILKSMKHPHIVELIDYHQTSAHFHLIMDYCSMGDLSYFIRKRNQLIKTHPVISSLLDRYPSPEGSHGLNETLVLHFLKQLSSALEFLRSKSLVHRDIKPQNLLLCPPVHSKHDFVDANYVGLWELPILKIADFGFARFLPSTSMAETLCGSPLYMAPEILRYEKYNAKADLWSVGAVLYEMTLGKPPFKASNHIELLKNIEKSNDRIKFPSSAKVPESLKKMIRSLLKYNPTERISFNEFFNDPLITSDLESNDKPLETSEMDENLFISEYISPIKDKPNRIESLTPNKKESLQSVHSSHSNNDSNNAMTGKININNSNRSRNNRDEEIKKIIDKNSPGPETLSNSIKPHQEGTKSMVVRNKDDVFLEKDYVVVEKRAVEVNAIADELAHAGSGALAMNPRKTSIGSNSSSESGQSPSNYARRLSSRSDSNNSQPRRPSLNDRRISISISPSNALTKAIGLASNRLFGVNANQIVDETNNKLLLNDNLNEINQSDNAISTVFTSPNFTNNLLLQKLNLPTSATVANNIQNSHLQNLQLQLQHQKNLSNDEQILIVLESLATKAYAINLFADVKFSQLIPSPPSNDDSDNDLLHQTDILPPKMVKAIGEEGVVLYVKVLSLLAKGMTIASDWWYDEGDIQGSPKSSKEMGKSNANLTISVKINELVQWIREKFNECLEKAEFVKLRLQEVDSVLSVHADTSDGNLTNLFGDSSNSRVFAEKLIFDRALEMSRNAAVNELVKEDLKGCELSYSTAIWMLEAILDEDTNKDVNKLDLEDRQMIEKFIISIGNRLSVLKRKLEAI